MKNFFYAPAKSTLDAAEIRDFIASLGHLRFAEADTKENQSLMRRLKASEKRSDVSSIAVILTAPSDNKFQDGNTRIAVGRGITDIGEYALGQKIPTYICRCVAGNYFFFPVIHLDLSLGSGNWKTDYSHAILDLPQTASQLFS